VLPLSRALASPPARSSLTFVLTDVPIPFLNHVLPMTLVLVWNSSMFFDEDGDLGHEFYKETKWGIERVFHGLLPQGVIHLDCPAISPHVKTVILPNHTNA
jgi:hypothetical protein